MRATPAEMMVIESARRLRDGDVVFVGVGQPNLAANLAIRLHAPSLRLVYESGIIGARPSRMPLSIGDPCLVTGAQLVCSMYEVFSFYLQRGLIDVGFLGAAQVDRFGNLNSTVIGPYDSPKVRLAGSGGACDIATLAKRLIILTPHQLRRLPERVDFITSPGFLGGRAERERAGMPGGGPEVVITDLGILAFDESGEMVLTSLHPGVELAQILANTGWQLKVSPDIARTPEASDAELQILREELDPQGLYSKS